MRNCHRSVSHRWTVPSLLMLGVFALILSACGQSSDETTEPPQNAASRPSTPTEARGFDVPSQLIFGKSVDLAFEISGEVGELDVGVGDMVSAGDVLATVDSETIRDLRYAESQSLYQIDKLQDDLDRVLGLESSDPLVRAQAEGSLAKAELRLQMAQDNLEDYLLQYDVDLGTARKTVADAKFALDQAQDAVSDFADMHGESFAAAVARRSEARARLNNAQDVVTDFLPLHNEAVAALESRIARVENDLDQAQDALRDFDVNHAQRLASARVRLADVEADLEKAEDAFEEFHVMVIEGQFLNLDDGRNFDVVKFEALQAAVDSARRDVEFWQTELTDLEAGPKEAERTGAQATVTRLELELERLNRQLREELAGPDQTELDRLESNVLVAKETLDRAERDLAELEQGIDQLKLASLEAGAESARLALEAAESRLARLEEGIDQAVLADMNQQIVTAREAREELAAGPDAAAVALAQAHLDDAKSDYDEIAEDLEHSYLRAPFSGMVRLVTIKEGDVITVDARVIQLVDPTNISIRGLVEANNVERIEVGTPGSVTVAALPDVELEAQVREISPHAKTERGVISFPVEFAVVVPSGVTIPANPGLVTTTVRP
ncbi:MAG: HlyD family efflux transporter periplasmic adaptor subunit [Chloroflexota bacterium]|nr:HlyD family efflux transporter periplasmic adaptor subunit [Chloroflexota bacterium]